MGLHLPINVAVFCFGLLLFLGPVSLAAQSATALPIQNPSFEMTNGMLSGCGPGCNYNFDIGIPGWTIKGDGGSFQPSPAYLTLPTQDGLTVAYSDGGTIGQVLSSALQANTTYTLSVDVGHRMDGLTTGYTIELLAGGNILNSISGNSASIPAGTVATEMVSYTTGATVTSGQLLEIRLISTGNQSDFDDVTLTYIPSEPTITSVNNATFILGATGTFTATATGTPAPTWSESGMLPAGVTFNTTSGVLAGTPATGGTYPITLTAQNGVLPNASQSFTLTVDFAPAITNVNNATFTVGTPGTFTAAATGMPAPAWSETGSLPGGVTLNPTTGVLSGTPTTGGTFPITLMAQNGVAPNASQSFTLTVNSPPAITSANNATFTMGTPGTFTATATGTPAPTWSETGSLPVGVTLNATTGVLSGTPTTGGTSPITLTAQNGVLPSATQSFTLTVNSPPAITSANNATFTMGTPGTFTATATGAPAPTWSETGSLPGGVTLNPTTGVLSGTPTAGGTFPITLTAQNGVLPSASQSFTLTVNSPPAITSANNATFTMGTPGTFTATAAGTPASTWSESGSLPTGVTLNATTGVLSGTPTVGGTFPITLTVQNGVLPNASQSFTLTINSPPAISSANNATFTLGTPGTFAATATGTPAPTWSETGTLPTGVTLNATTGVLSGTPTTGGTFPITLTAQNGVLPSASQSFTLTVNSPPAITSTNNATFTLGTPGTFTATATGTPAATWSENGTLPTGVTLNATTGVLSGTPLAGGTYTITLTAQNGVTPNASQSFTLTVNSPPAITSAKRTTFTLGAPGTFTLSATGAPAPSWSESGTLPSGVTFNATTGILSGTPTAGGIYPITFTAQNGVAPNASQSFTLTVNSPPAITSANNAVFTLGAPGSFTAMATGTPAPTGSVSGTLPNGVTFNGTTGILSGTPTVSGRYPITFTAQNGISPNASQNFTLDVISNQTIPIQNPSFEITNGMLSGCGPGCSYNFDGGIPGWTITGDGGSFQPGPAYLTLPTQDGLTVAYSNGGTIGQVLTSTLQPSTAYTLSVDVGHRLDGLATGYTIELLAGGNILNSISGNSASIPAGAVATQTVSYTSGTTVTAGQLLEIRLISAGNQGDFDNVSLTAITAPVTLPIQNPSFETTNGMLSSCGPGCSYNYDAGIPGWTITGDGGSFQPSAAYLTLPPQDGLTVAYSNGGTIGQVLTCALKANATYTLSVDVGHRLDGSATNYTIELLAGSNILNSVTGNTATIPAGSVITQSVTYTSGPAVTAGQMLQILLISAGNQGDFDNVTLTEIPSAPVIAAPPQNQTINVGNAATFTVAAMGASPLTYQWQRNNVNIVGATSPSYTTPATAAGDSGAQFSVLVTNPFGVAVSTAASLTVDFPPSIVMNPSSQTLAAGESAVFTVIATGTQPLTYQWFENGVSIPNATSQSYTAPPVGAGDNGDRYQVVVSNSLQSVPSSIATLTVVAHTSPSIYYVDSQDGLDTNSGISKSSPWMNAPGMAACSNNCKVFPLQPGDRVIFEGGDVWPAGSFPMSISASGTNGNPIYFGVDPTWFTGNSWTRPIFDLENATWTAAPVVVNSSNFVTLDNIEIRNEEIANNTSGVFTSGISVNGGSNVTIENCYIHGWSIKNPQLGSDTFSSGGIAFYNGSTTGTVKNCVLDASPEADSGTGIYGGSVIQGNIIENMPKGIVVDDPTANVSGNQVFNVTYSVDEPVNSNAIFAYTSANIYNNTVHDLVPGASAMYLEADNSGTGNTQAIYNNLIWNVGDAGPVTIASDNMAPASVSNQFIYNNTFDAGSSSSCVNVVVNFYSPTNLTVQNNHCISDLPSSQAWCWNNANGNFDCGLVTNLTFGNNVLMPSATATAQGYTIANSFQPLLPSSATVGAALNLSSSCAAIGMSLCGDRLGIARPAGSAAWDAGAYLYQPGDNLSPAITSQPVRQAVAVGHQATFSVIATGAGPLSFQWLKNGNAISGANLSTYTTPATAATDDGTLFTVVVSNAIGSITSSPATLSINTSPGQLVPSTTNLLFGPVDIGASGTTSIALTNMSNSYVTIAGISVSGAGLSASGVPSGLILAAGEVATLNIAFAPSGSGLVTGSVSIYSDAAGSPLTIPVSGTGTAPAHLVTVTWSASTSVVFGYNVYRSTNPSGYYTKLNSTPVTSTQYTDLAVQPGQTYYYWVTSVAADPMESTLSKPASVTVPSP